MNTEFCFVRHGRTDCNISMLIQGRIDNPLSELGKKDPICVAELIKKYNLDFDIIISSPLSRAKDTANIIKNHLQLDIPIIINPDFIEREFGSAEGAPITPENYEKVMNNDFEGMEKDYEICKRTKNGLFKLIKEYEGKKILVVCHSHVIKSLFMQFSDNVKFNSKFGHHSINLLSFNGYNLLDCKFSIES